MSGQRFAVVLATLALAISACSISTSDINSAPLATDGQSEQSVEAQSTVAATPEPSRNDGPCGSLVQADTSAPVGPVPTQEPLGAAEIEELASAAPSSDLERSVAVVAIDAGDPASKFVLGPAWPVQIESAEGIDIASRCSVEIVMTAEGLDTFNLIAAECFRSAEVCPLQRLAIVADGQVLSHPTIQSARFDSPQIMVTSGTAFGADETPELVRAIANGAQFRPVLLGPIPV